MSRCREWLGGLSSIVCGSLSALCWTFLMHSQICSSSHANRLPLCHGLVRPQLDSLLTLLCASGSTRCSSVPRSDAHLWRNGHPLVMVARRDATFNGICATLARFTRFFGFFSSSRILFLHDCQRLATMVSGLSCEDPEVRSFVPAGGAVKLCDEGSAVIIDAREPREVGI